MGAPMALNLSRHYPITVWNRSPHKYAPLLRAGAKAGATPSHVVQDSDVIFMMLFDTIAINDIFDGFKTALAGKTLVNAGSVPEEFSHHLAAEVSQVGGQFVEMPVSGSQIPAEKGQLVGLLGGDGDVIEKVRPVLEPMISAAVHCGPIGYGLRTKNAVNLYLTALTVGLAESANLARAQGLDLGVLREVLNTGPMASAYSHIKISKIIDHDWSTQAAIKACYYSSDLICNAAEASGVRSPLAQLCRSMYAEATDAGFGEEDLIAIIKILSGSPPK
ncbi:putative gamma hydroxybutyrate dehydrogenase [Rosellinia necatrix]|uniref:Putative gamma hydroxybutyrate dehydrogenase n=1 Tax=Rosellinia necatrix TaxID=77044 RepID=A0A1W2THN5_ROSNE|nr:putative gamma hydroxybutyrate dehydrogenase [Rosellinia necatrix]